MQKNSEQPRAIPFIIFRKPEGFIVTEEAKKFFNHYSGRKIAIVSIVGKYRTGKSYLINKVILQNSCSYLRDSQSEKPAGFQVGSTVNACTKGIWLWTRAIPSENPEEEDTLVMVMDTEGFGAVTEGNNHDTRIILFSMLLSSMFVYNSVGNIDENALQTLGMVVNMAKNIQLESSGSEELDEDTIAETFPLFLWVVRDFSLQLVDENNFKISSGLYFEKALEKVKGHSSKTEGKNKVRRLIKHFFKKRECITMIRPVENETDLQKLEELPDYKLRKDFLQQIQKTRGIIFQRVTAKRINGNFVDGPRLIALAEAYVESVNNGRAPCIENAWEFVKKFENKKTAEKTIGIIRNVVDIQNSEGNMGINLNFEEMLSNSPSLKLPRKIKTEIQELSKQVLGNYEDYQKIKPLLEKIYVENLLGEVWDNEDLIKDFSVKLDERMKGVFRLLEGEVEKTVEKEIESKVESETKKLLESETLQLEECHEGYDEIWNRIEEDFGKYFCAENGLKEKAKAIFEREKAKTYGRLLKEVHNRQELEQEQRNKNEKVRLFREQEAKRRVQEEIQEYKSSLNEIKKKNAERLVAFRQKKKDFSETTQKVLDLEQENQKLKKKIQNEKNLVHKLENENDEIKQKLQEKFLLLENEQKNRTREQAMASQKELLMQNKTDELKNEIDQLRNELKKEKKKIKENQKKMKLIREEQDREDRVVMDSQQLKILQDKLQEFVERLGKSEQEKEKLQMELKERETENGLLKGRVEIMEKNFQEIEFKNREFLANITKRVDNIKQAQPEKLSQSLTLNLQKFALWKKILKICNLFQCGKCSKFIPKKLILIHLNNCLSSNELQILGLIEASQNSLEEIGIDNSPRSIQPNITSQRPISASNLSVKMVQSLVREQEVEGESRPYTEYIFKVYNDNLDLEWHVSRKFKEFCQLLVDLQNRNQAIELPQSCFELWSYVNDIWGLIGNSSVNLDKRLELLQKMMNDLVKSKHVMEIDIFQDFVCLGEAKEGVWN